MFIVWFLQSKIHSKICDYDRAGFSFISIYLWTLLNCSKILVAVSKVSSTISNVSVGVKLSGLKSFVIRAIGGAWRSQFELEIGLKIQISLK